MTYINHDTPEWVKRKAGEKFVITNSNMSERFGLNYLLLTEVASEVIGCSEYIPEDFLGNYDIRFTALASEIVLSILENFEVEKK